jgi:hypothetical protein
MCCAKETKKICKFKVIDEFPQPQQFHESIPSSQPTHLDEPFDLKKQPHMAAISKHTFAENIHSATAGDLTKFSAYSGCEKIHIESI